MWGATYAATFADLVGIASEGIVTAKAGNTPPNIEQDVIATIAKAGISCADFDFLAQATRNIPACWRASKGSGDFEHSISAIPANSRNIGMKPS